VRDQPAGLIRIWNPKLRPQFTQQWNLTLEYQLTNTMSVSAAYVGNKATNLIAPTDWNQPLPGIGPPSTWLPAQQRRPLFSALPLVTAISGTDSWSRSNYHSGQFSARQRFARGLRAYVAGGLDGTAAGPGLWSLDGGWVGLSARGALTRLAFAPSAELVRALATGG